RPGGGRARAPNETPISLALQEVEDMSDTDAEINAGNDLDRAIQIVSAAGYMVVREKSYKQAQERQRVAEVRREAEERADAELLRLRARDEAARAVVQ